MAVQWTSFSFPTPKPPQPRAERSHSTSSKYLIKNKSFLFPFFFFLPFRTTFGYPMRSPWDLKLKQLVLFQYAFKLHIRAGYQSKENFDIRASCEALLDDSLFLLLCLVSCVKKFTSARSEQLIWFKRVSFSHSPSFLLTHFYGFSFACLLTCPQSCSFCPPPPFSCSSDDKDRAG